MPGPDRLTWLLRVAYMLQRAPGPHPCREGGEKPEGDTAQLPEAGVEQTTAWSLRPRPHGAPGEKVLVEREPGGDGGSR